MVEHPGLVFEREGKVSAVLRERDDTELLEVKP